MKKLFFLIAAGIPFLSATNAQQGPSISGKVFIGYKTAVNNKSSTISKKYLSDFKVLAIPKTGTTNIKEITNYRKNFCANDKSLFSRYRVKAAYTNYEGYFEIKGLLPNQEYILIYCDSDIQVSEVRTGNANVNYSIGQRSIRL